MGFLFGGAGKDFGSFKAAKGRAEENSTNGFSALEASTAGLESCLKSPALAEMVSLMEANEKEDMC